jgi:CDGSH-type Zn-finger protein
MDLQENIILFADAVPSNNKPFCDGMHKSINFMDDNE